MKRLDESWRMPTIPSDITVRDVARLTSMKQRQPMEMNWAIRPSRRQLLVPLPRIPLRDALDRVKGAPSALTWIPRSIASTRVLAIPPIRHSTLLKPFVPSLMPRTLSPARGKRSSSASMTRLTTPCHLPFIRRLTVPQVCQRRRDVWLRASAPTRWTLTRTTSATRRRAQCRRPNACGTTLASRKKTESPRRRLHSPSSRYTFELSLIRPTQMTSCQRLRTHSKCHFHCTHPSDHCFISVHTNIFHGSVGCNTI